MGAWADRNYPPIPWGGSVPAHGPKKIALKMCFSGLPAPKAPEVLGQVPVTFGHVPKHGKNETQTIVPCDSSTVEISSSLILVFIGHGWMIRYIFSPALAWLWIVLEGFGIIIVVVGGRFAKNSS